MQTLNEVCKGISDIAGKTTYSPVQRPYSSASKGGLMITDGQLLQNSPQDNDKNLLQYLRHTLNISLTCEVKSSYGEYGWEGKREFKVKHLSEKQKQAAMQAIQAYEAPMPRAEIAQLMARLSVIAPERQKSNYDVQARIAVWCEELEKYPADVVNKVLRGRFRWFPSLAEVLDKCDDETELRRALAEKIRLERAEA